MAAFLDNCKFNPTLGGTTDWTFSSAALGYQSPSAAGVVNGRLYKYFAISADQTQWELGQGAYNTGTGVLARTTILFSTNSNAKVTFSAAPTVAIVAVKEDMISIEEANAFTTAQKAQARTNISAVLRGHLVGLTLSTAGASTTFSVAAGEAADSTFVDLMALASAYAKTTSAWALGTAAGSLDTGSIAASTWYHAYLIKRPDTGVVDVLISLSATAPTLPTNYTLFRRIGAMKTNASSQWTLFRQDGDVFTWDVPVTEVASFGFSGTTQIFVTLAGAPPARVRAFGPVWLQSLAIGGSLLITGADQTDTTPTSNNANVATPNNTVAMRSSGWWSVYTSTSGSIRYRINASDANSFFNLVTIGYEDTRGRFS